MQSNFVINIFNHSPDGCDDGIRHGEIETREGGF
jgi:hypothetical protein